MAHIPAVPRERFLDQKRLDFLRCSSSSRRGLASRPARNARSALRTRLSCDNQDGALHDVINSRTFALPRIIGQGLHGAMIESRDVFPVAARVDSEEMVSRAPGYLRAGRAVAEDRISMVFKRNSRS